MRQERGRRPRLNFGAAAVVAAFVLAAAVPGGAAPVASVAGPAGAETPFGVLRGVACPTSSRCVAVGYGFDDVKVNIQPIVGLSNGLTWSIRRGPVPTSTKADHGGRMYGAACVAATRCFGVGWFNLGIRTRTLILAWNGAGWSVFSRPDPAGSSSSVLSGIACPTSTMCLAVGNAAYGDPAPTRTLVTRWNGASWSVVPSPNASATSRDNALNAISCRTATFCVAVGAASRKTTSRTLVEQWNGKAWSVVPSPNPTDYAVLTSISCATTTACVAVGYQRSPYKGFIEQWNGSRWALAAAPVPTTGTSFLRGVACPTAKRCYAVGLHNATSTLMLQWDGKRWSTAPGSASDGVVLEAITCRSATSCQLVGAYVSTHGNPYVAQWDGVSPLAQPRS